MKLLKIKSKLKKNQDLEPPPVNILHCEWQQNGPSCWETQHILSLTQTFSEEKRISQKLMYLGF